MNKLDKNKKLIMQIVGVLILILVVIGTTYAAFIFSKLGSTVNSITTGTITMTYTESVNGITLSNAMPTSDSVGKTLSNDNQLFDFTVKSSITGNQAVSFEVTAVKDASSTLKNDEVRLYLEKSTDGNNYSEVMEPTVYTEISTDDNFGAKSGEMILDRGTISTTETSYYRLRMWVGKNYELNDKKNNFSVKVNVYGITGTYVAQDEEISVPTITLNGEDTTSVEEGSIYTDPGVSQIDDDSVSPSNIQTTYTYYDANSITKVNSKSKSTASKMSIKNMATSVSKVDTNKSGIYFITYKITNSKGITGKSVRTVNVYKSGSTIPTITLSGDKQLEIKQNSTYTETGYIAQSGTENITSSVITEGTVDTTKVGTYIIKYLVKDSNGNITGTSRIVKIKRKAKVAVCKRATTLHSEECTQTSNYCTTLGYTTSGSKGTTTIIYGNLGSVGTLTSGDAFDCDVNGDGNYDPATERFYYVAEQDSDTAVMIYYNNTISGLPNSNGMFAYDANGNAYQNGPATALLQLPKTSQWINVSLKNTSRDLVDNFGNIKKTGFSYAGYATRFLTTQEISLACNFNVGTRQNGELKNCIYLMENTKFSNVKFGSYGFWLENPISSYANYSWYVDVLFNSVNYTTNFDINMAAVRPAIEVPKSDINY